MNDFQQAEAGFDNDLRGFDLAIFAAPVFKRWKTVVSIGLLTGCAVFGASYSIAERFTASCLFLPPQQQGSASGALASLGALSSLVGGAAGASKSTPDQYVAFMQSATVLDRIARKFDLRKVFHAQYEVDARNRLDKQTRVTVGKRDGLITVEFTDTDPNRAAAIANQYVEELRTLTNTLAVSEAQQRRLFFEHLLEQTRDNLATAQRALEGSGINAAAVNTEPHSAAQNYAQVKARLTAAEVQLTVLRTTLADSSVEVQRQQETIAALNAQLEKLGTQNRDGSASGDYVNRYREFKYQETLFELYARQYESARVDESREGALIQVVDSAKPPERKSFPNHGLFGISGTLAGLLLGAILVIALERRKLRRSSASVT